MTTEPTGRGLAESSPLVMRSKLHRTSRMLRHRSNPRSTTSRSRTPASKGRVESSAECTCCPHAKNTQTPLDRGNTRTCRKNTDRRHDNHCQRDTDQGYDPHRVPHSPRQHQAQEHQTAPTTEQQERSQQTTKSKIAASFDRPRSRVSFPVPLTGTHFRLPVDGLLAVTFLASVQLAICMPQFVRQQGRRRQSIYICI